LGVSHSYVPGGQSKGQLRNGQGLLWQILSGKLP